MKLIPFVALVIAIVLQGPDGGLRTSSRAEWIFAALSTLWAVAALALCGWFLLLSFFDCPKGPPVCGSPGHGLFGSKE